MNNFQCVNRHRLANIIAPCQVIIKTKNCRFTNILDFHLSDFGADKVLIHIQVINISGLFQTDLVLFPQIASGTADAVTFIAVDFCFLLTQFTQRLCIGTMTLLVAVNPPIHITMLFFAVAFTIFQHMIVLIFTAFHSRLLFYSIKQKRLYICHYNRRKAFLPV